ncbi:hypothetical protein GV67_10920 [Pseudorhizobium pelagicum]|uniref:Uncharacterized protein n=1 Tax=Pseudorhizobium pelagicum TaxID=1509405 RepID=A0A922NYI8_9HYPH|nr:hypothetical protein GV67_10920 [Pseudorhizobium pelagicum]KEQ04457.1 hypothetical protein GV68_13360 [Pseudorhizobium pelagicum]
MGLKGYYMRYMLVGPHDDEAPLFPVYASHVEDMPSLHGHRAEDFFVVDEAVSALCGKRKAGRALQRKVAALLLEYDAKIDHRVDVLVWPRIG